MSDYPPELLFIFSSALLMFWLLPAFAFFSLRPKRNNTTYIWFSGNFSYAAAATLFITSYFEDLAIFRSLTMGFSLLSVFLLTEGLRRENKRSNIDIQKILFTSSLYASAILILEKSEALPHSYITLIHLSLITVLDLKMLVEVSTLIKTQGSRALTLILLVFLAFTITNLIRILGFVYSNILGELLDFSPLSYVALTLNYLSPVLYTFGYWGYILEKENSEKNQLLGDLAESRDRETKEIAKSIALERIHAERESLYIELLRINRLAHSSALSATVAHELNQPIAAACLYIESAIHVIRKSADVQSATPLLERAINSNIRASKLIERMKALFTNGTNAKQNIMIDDVIRDFLETLAPLVNTASIPVETDLNVQKPIIANAAEIEQLLMNLFSNAVEAARKEKSGWIKIVTHQSKKNATLEILNNGPQLTHKSDEEIFDLFRTEKSHGMGVGLWLSKHIAERNSGDLCLDRSNAEATCFKLTLGNANT